MPCRQPPPPREEFITTAPGFIRPNRLLADPMWRVVVERLWKVRMSAWLVHLPPAGRNRPLRSSRGGCRQRTGIPTLRKHSFHETTDVPHAPRSPACVLRAASPAGEVAECRGDPLHSTPRALQPLAAVVTSMPCAAHHAVSNGRSRWIRRGDQLLREPAFRSFSSPRAGADHQRVGVVPRRRPKSPFREVFRPRRTAPETPRRRVWRCQQ